MFGDKTIKEFLKETASNSPVPGGGSMAALSAAASSALVTMVAGLTAGKKGYETYEKEMREIMEAGNKETAAFVNYMDKDSDAFYKVMEGFKLPKETEEQKAVRKETLQTSFKEAASVPLQVAKAALKLMDYTEKVVENGNKNAVTDGLVATMMARTAVLSALYNVKINLSSIKDEEFVNEVKKEIEYLEKEAIKRETEILSKASIAY